MACRFFICHFLITATLIPSVITLIADGNSTLPLNVIDFGTTPWIDPRFMIVSEYGLPILPGIPCLMNAVNAMQDLALEDFQEPLIPTPYILDGFPEVSISSEATVPGGAIQTRFIIWGIWLGLKAMMDRRIFHTAVFTLRYAGVTVGYVKVARPQAQLIDAGSNGTHTLARRFADVNPASWTPEYRAQKPRDEQMTASFNEIGPPLSGSDVLMAILYGLIYVAPFPNTAEVRSFKLSLPVPLDKMHIDIHQVEAASPPFLECRWIVKSLSQIPQFMLERRRFSGVSMKMRVGRVTVGEGTIFRKVEDGP